MKGGYKAMRASVETSPLALAYMDDKLKSIADSMLPFTVGFEFETSGIKPSYFDIVEKKLIDLWRKGYLHDVIESSNYEYRFTLCKGIKGMIGLYYVLELFKENLVFNSSRGIHIHVYVPKKYREQLKTHLFANISPKSNYILKVLDAFEYDGQYNTRMVGKVGSTWVRTNNNYETLEYRIFKLTFNYSKLIKIVLKLVELNKLIFKASGLAVNSRYGSALLFETKSQVEKSIEREELRKKSKRKYAAEKVATKRKKIKNIVKKDIEKKPFKVTGRVVISANSTAVTTESNLERLRNLGFIR